MLSETGAYGCMSEGSWPAVAVSCVRSTWCNESDQAGYGCPRMIQKRAKTVMPTIAIASHSDASKVTWSRQSRRSRQTMMATASASRDPIL